RDLAVREGVRAAGDVHAPPGRGSLALRPARARVGPRVREPLEHRRRLRPPPARQDRRAVRAAFAGDGARGGLSSAGGGRSMRSVPIRIRVAGAFAVAMVVVLAGTGWFVYANVSSHLTQALDQNLRLRADDLSALVRQPHASLAETSNSRFIELGEAYAQLL